jgi:hypothetical protein
MAMAWASRRDGSSAGRHYADESLTDLAWYDEGDLLKSAVTCPLWSDEDRYASRSRRRR